MSPFTRRTLSLVVSPTAIELVPPSRRRDGTTQRTQLAQVQPGPSSDAVAAAFNSISEDALPRGSSLSLTLAGTFARLFLATPPPNATRLEDLRASATLRFTTLYGTAPDRWRIAAAWSLSAPFLAAAVADDLLGALAKFASERQLVLRRVAPSIVDQWNFVRRTVRAPETWIVSKEGALTTLLVGRKNQIQAIRQVRWGEEIWECSKSLREAIALEALKLDRSPPDHVHGVGDIPIWISANADSYLVLQQDSTPSPLQLNGRSQALDLNLIERSTVSAKPTAGSMVLGMVATAILALGVFQFEQLETQRRDLSHQLSALLHRVAANQASHVDQPSAALNADQVISVNRAIRQLNLPWHRLLSEFEASTPQEIALLSIEPDAKHASVRGTAEAPNAIGMLDYLTQLKGVGHFGTVFLTRHEMNEQDPMHPIRFQFEVRWDEVPE